MWPWMNRASRCRLNKVAERRAPAMRDNIWMFPQSWGSAWIATRLPSGHAPEELAGALVLRS